MNEENEVFDLSDEPSDDPIEKKLSKCDQKKLALEELDVSEEIIVPGFLVNTDDSEEGNLAELTINVKTLSIQEMDYLLCEYTEEKSTYTVEETDIQVVHSVTLGDIFVMLLLTLLLFTQILIKVIGRR